MWWFILQQLGRFLFFCVYYVDLGKNILCTDCHSHVFLRAMEFVQQKQGVYAGGKLSLSARSVCIIAYFWVTPLWHCVLYWIFSDGSMNTKVPKQTLSCIYFSGGTEAQVYDSCLFHCLMYYRKVTQCFSDKDSRRLQVSFAEEYRYHSQEWLLFSS